MVLSFTLRSDLLSTISKQKCCKLIRTPVYLYQVNQNIRIQNLDIMNNLTHNNKNRFSLNPTKAGRKAIMQAAWAIYKADNNIETFAEALALSWKRFKITVIIQNAKGGIPFTFLKSDMTERKAIAKHNFLISPKQYNCDILKNPYVFAFIDLSKGHTTASAKFRYFRIDRLRKFPFIVDNSNAYVNNVFDKKGKLVKTTFAA